MELKCWVVFFFHVRLCSVITLCLFFFLLISKEVKIQETNIPVSSLKFDCMRIEMKDFTTNLAVQDENA